MSLKFRTVAQYLLSLLVLAMSCFFILSNQSSSKLTNNQVDSVVQNTTLASVQYVDDLDATEQSVEGNQVKMSLPYKKVISPLLAKIRQEDEPPICACIPPELTPTNPNLY